MIVAIDSSCEHPLLPFIQTLFDITLLRKGPQHIPRSVVMLLLAITLWLFARLATLALISGSDEQSFIIDVFSVFFSSCIYAAVIVFARRSPRLLQSMTAIIGVSGMMRVIYVAVHSLLQPFVGLALMQIIVIATILWSISVKGHIIASAIDRHWYVGLAVAVTVTVMQIAFELSMITGP